MCKISLGKNAFVLPAAQTILGCHLNGKPNFMALAWLSRVNANPAMIGVTVNKSNSSHDAILETKEFSISFPSVDMVTITDYIGIVSGKKVDKSELFEVFYGDLKTAPMIKNCPLTIELKMSQIVELPTNSFLIGEIINSYTEEKYLTNGKPDIKKINPFVLTMPDNRFWAIGDCVGFAWKDGLKLKEK